MDYILYLFRSLYRVKWWILLGTLIISAIAYYLTGNMKGGYNVEATLYTGVVSGYSIEENTKVYHHSGGYSGRRRKEKERTEKTGTEICYSEGKER